ncbi:MAG: ABC transporter ATP-binding protein [Acidimicrobiaceae bacterium]|nr:ABC transporter ATP-binding protein [Acidimicrobiaceae bacterium]
MSAGHGDGLQVVGLRHAFGERHVLDGVDLDVPAGRVVGLLGPNGAGKTTLMRIVFGVLDVQSGAVRWQGRAVTDADRRRWGYMPQERGLYQEMRTIDHLVWLARLYGVERRDAERRAHDLLERLGLGDRADDAVRDLSGGMAQRVQLAAAMVHGPELLVLDEPFAGLDPVATEFLTDVIREHVSAGGHLVFSSHQLDLVQDLCERIVMIHHGHVVLEGAVRELREQAPERYLRVDVEVDPTWFDRTGDPHTDVEVVASAAAASRIRMAPGTDAGAVLDVVRRQRRVTDFAVEAPSLSELFIAAAGPVTDELELDVNDHAHGDGAGAGVR